MKRIWILLSLVLIIAFAGTVAATPSSDGSAPESYGQATHTTDNWQRLGASGNTNDGVAWSVDGGATYGWDDLIVGQQVIFRFDFHRAAYGVHAYDQIMAWVDWNGSGTFEHPSERILAEQWGKQQDGDSNWMTYRVCNNGNCSLVDYRNASGNSGDADNYFVSTYGKDGNPNDALLEKFFFAALIVPDIQEDVLETWLRVRVNCTDAPWNNMGPTMGPTGHLYQGETEDWRIRITKKQVPEPMSLILFALGLLGLAGIQRKIR